MTAIATEARRAETSGSVHEGAGRQALPKGPRPRPSEHLYLKTRQTPLQAVRLRAPEQPPRAAARTRADNLRDAPTAAAIQQGNVSKSTAGGFQWGII